MSRVRRLCIMSVLTTLPTEFVLHPSFALLASPIGNYRRGFFDKHWGRSFSFGVGQHYFIARSCRLHADDGSTGRGMGG